MWCHRRFDGGLEAVSTSSLIISTVDDVFFLGVLVDGAAAVRKDAGRVGADAAGTQQRRRGVGAAARPRPAHPPQRRTGARR